MDSRTQEDPAAYAVALNELAQLKLSEGKTAEAQDLFRKALDVQQGLTAGASGGGPAAEELEEEEDWETRWDSGRGPTVVSACLPNATRSSAADRRPAPRQREPASSSSASTKTPAAAAASPAVSSGGGGGEDVEVPFGGAHILEILDLDTSVKTTQLEHFLTRLLPNPEVPPVLKWVDDYRALALFSNPRQAQAALAAAADLQPAGSQAVYSVRRWADASALSRAVPAAELAAPKPRPLTTSTVARRLIGSALGGGMTSRLRDREEERVLATARKELRAVEAQRREKLDEAWED